MHARLILIITAMAIPAIHATGAVVLGAAALLCTSCATGLTPTEKMMWSTYLIASPKGVATCVIVNRKDSSAPGGVLPVLVTSAHVLESAPHGPFYIAYRSPRTGQNPDTEILEIDPPNQGHRPFVRHPRCDVAAMEIWLPPELINEVTLPSFLEADGVTLRDDEPHPGSDVSVLGYPSVYPGTEGAFAVLRGGRVASYSVGPPSDRQVFLLNTNVYSGDSGGPVFLNSRHGKPRLVGVLTERIGKKEGSVPLAIAVSASVVSETLKLAEAQGRLEQDRRAALAASAQDEIESVRLLGPLKSFRSLLNSPRKHHIGSPRHVSARAT